MKYQDPLEPTDNTEYISQLATFSELEEMQNMVQTSDRQRAGALVGQYVMMSVNDSTGNTTNTEGYVDSVVYQGNKTYLEIKGVLYNFDDLAQVYDNTYLVQKRVEELEAAEKEKAEKDAAEKGVVETEKVEDAEFSVKQEQEVNNDEQN